MQWAPSCMALCCLLAVDSASAAVVRITVDSASSPEQTALPKFWQASVGSGHARLGLRQDWRRQLSAVHRDTGIHGVRFHGSLDDEMGPVVTLGESGPVYNFTLLDQVYDGIMAAGVRPIVELSFMPSAIANCTPGTTGEDHCRTRMHYHALEASPKSPELWRDLVHAFVRHLVSRYGLDEVSKWRFEVWNELWGISMGDGSPGNSPYMSLYNASYHAVKAVSPGLSIGGPATAKLKDLVEFVQACRAWRIPLAAPDFVSTHYYPSDSCIQTNSSSLDCFSSNIISARRQVQNQTFLLTEVNCGLGQPGAGVAYAAAFLLRTVNALRMHNVAALSWWTFSAIFEERHLPRQEVGPFGANSAMQTVHGIPMPVYRGFQLLRDAGDAVLPVRSSGGMFDQAGPLTVMATRNTTAGHQAVVIFLGNLPRADGGAAAGPAGNQTLANETQTVELTVLQHGRVGRSLALVRSINSTCANPKGVWITDMQSVQWPSTAQLAALRASSQMCEDKVSLRWETGEAKLNLSVEAYGVTQVLII